MSKRVIFILAVLVASFFFFETGRVQGGDKTDLQQQIDAMKNRLEFLEFDHAVLSAQVYAEHLGLVATISLSNSNNKKYVTFTFGQPNVAFYPDAVFGGATFQRMERGNVFAKLYSIDGKLLDSYSVSNLTAGQLVIAWWADPLSGEFPSVTLPMRYPACYWNKVTGLAVSVMNFDDSGPNVC